ncbi:hypothetical protein I3760_03G161900 [Carya illinoinensis]|nr:hypothetical protein I3760_03G161900 [Carya illinoinensis]
MNKVLMALLLKLDSVPGVYPSLRDARRKVSHRRFCVQRFHSWVGFGLPSFCFVPLFFYADRYILSAFNFLCKLYCA